MQQNRLTIVVVFSIVMLIFSNLYADDKVETESLVDKATTVVQGFSADPDLGWFRDKVKEARALLIIPQSIKGAFFVGGSGGSGVLIARDGTSGEWGYPAFYTMGSLSIGLQFGGEASEVILMVMTERGMEKLLTSSFKLGADLTVAAGPVGGGAKAQTADVLTYARSKGAFGGMSIDGAVVKTRDQRNEAYYGKPVSPTDIIIRKSVVNPHADKLRSAVAAATAK
jgi:lipid-binding SYLF domain-containing protein